jgi:hypothetical protein
MSLQIKHQKERFTYADPPRKNDRTYADPPGGGFRISRFTRSKSTELEPDIDYLPHL